MSNAVTKICRPLQVTPAQKAVLMCLADHCHDDGIDWHSIAAMTAWTCLSKRAVIDALQALEGAGLVHRLHKGNGTRSSTRLQLAAIEAAVQNQCATRTSAGGAPVQQAHPTGAAGAPPPVQQAHHPVQQAHPKHQQASEKRQEPPSMSAAAATAPASQDDGFAQFWDAWPATARKQDRKRCLEKWRKSKFGNRLDEILAHVAAMKKTRGWRDGYEPAPLTYLTGHRWEDGMPPPDRQRLMGADDIFAGAK